MNHHHQSRRNTPVDLTLSSSLRFYSPHHTDKLLLLAIAAIPLIPAPTIPNSARYIAPATVVGLVAILMIHGNEGRPGVARTDSRQSVLFFLLALVLVIYATQIVVGGRWTEMEWFLSRVVMLGGILIILEWLSIGCVSLDQVYAALFFGFLVLSVLVILKGLTGSDVFVPVAAPRTYGIRMPFFKTTGIPRSFGEQGIMASAALAYLLVYTHRFRMWQRLLAGSLIGLTVLIGQSRNMLLAVSLVAVAFLIHRRSFRVPIARVLLAVAFLAPLAIDIAIPVLESTPVTNSILGESTFRENIDDRAIVQEVGIDLLSADLARSINGYGREAWLDHVERVAGLRISLHNNYLAQMIYLGLVGGTISMTVLYLTPAWRSTRHRVKDGRQRLLVHLSVLGAFVSLNFYEGWFSLTLMVEMAALWHLAFAQPRDIR